MGGLGEFVLGKLSRDPAAGDYLNGGYESKHGDLSANAGIAALRKDFPEIGAAIAGKRVLDIGCSEGMETLALSKLGAAEVHGIDIRIDAVRNRQLVRANPDNVMKFSVMDATQTAFEDGEFDAAVTCTSFEHFTDPFAVLKECARVVKKDGTIFLTSSVWAHPWGSHMHFFTKVPWVQYLFSERTIMTVRKKYRSDGAMRFCDVEGGLNKVGVASFLRMVDQLDLEPRYVTLNPVKGLTFLTKLPYLNELFTNMIIANLRKTA